MVGDKRPVIPPCQNMGGYITTPPPRIYALGSLYQHVSKLLIQLNFACTATSDLSWAHSAVASQILS